MADKYEEYDYEEVQGRAGRKGRTKAEAAKEKRSHATEGHKLAGKIKITKNMMNSHENEKDRKSLPQRTVSNESTESEGTRDEDVDVDAI
ncbi:hypothetical protein ACHWQZ_G008637 [Mnemiopsis leidyi]